LEGIGLSVGEGNISVLDTENRQHCSRCLGHDQQLYDGKENEKVKVYVHFVKMNKQKWNHGLHLKAEKKANERKIL
jgi:hypothetical protein